MPDTTTVKYMDLVNGDVFKASTAEGNKWYAVDWPYDYWTREMWVTEVTLDDEGFVNQTWNDSEPWVIPNPEYYAVTLD